MATKNEKWSTAFECETQWTTDNWKQNKKCINLFALMIIIISVLNGLSMREFFFIRTIFDSSDAFCFSFFFFLEFVGVLNVRLTPENGSNWYHHYPINMFSFATHFESLNRLNVSGENSLLKNALHKNRKQTVFFSIILDFELII